MLTWGLYSIDNGRIGSTFINHGTGQSVYLQPGDDEGDFFDQLEAYEDAYPNRPYEELLEMLWDDYHHTAHPPLAA